MTWQSKKMRIKLILSCFSNGNFSGNATTRKFKELKLEKYCRLGLSEFIVEFSTRQVKREHIHLSFFYCFRLPVGTRTFITNISEKTSLYEGILLLLSKTFPFMDIDAQLS